MIDLTDLLPPAIAGESPTLRAWWVPDSAAGGKIIYTTAKGSYSEGGYTLDEARYHLAARNALHAILDPPVTRSGCGVKLRRLRTLQGGMIEGVVKLQVLQ